MNTWGRRKLTEQTKRRNNYRKQSAAIKDTSEIKKKEKDTLKHITYCRDRTRQLRGIWNWFEWAETAADKLTFISVVTNRHFQNVKIQNVLQQISFQFYFFDHNQYWIWRHFFFINMKDKSILKKKKTFNEDWIFL